jgi:hypothetical protein
MNSGALLVSNAGQSALVCCFRNPSEGNLSFGDDDRARSMNDLLLDVRINPGFLKAARSNR